MSAKTVFTFAGGMVAGLILGVLLFSGGGGSSGGSGVPAPVVPQQPQVDKLKFQREIAQLNELVKTDPENYQAWKSLGDKNFDIENFQDSIAAYRKALSIDGSDPNVWTDMGVMYRRTQNFTKALEAFDEAIKRGPNHAVSRLNKGIVYIYDLKEYEKGIAAWEDFLQLEPVGQRADAVRRDMQQAKAQMAGPQTGELPADHPPIDTSGPDAQGEGDPASYFPKPE